MREMPILKRRGEVTLKTLKPEVRWACKSDFI